MATLVEALKPFIFGALLAYVLSLPCDVIQNQLLKTKMPKKLVAVLSVILTELLFLLLLSAFLIAVVPQCITSITKIINNLPEYTQALHTQLVNILDNSPILEVADLSVSDIESKIADGITSGITSGIESITKSAYEWVTIISQQVVNIIVCYISSIFILFNRGKVVDAFKSILTKLCKTKADKILKIVADSNDTFRQFIVGKFFDSLIVGIVCFIIFTILQIPYATFNATFVGVTNMIPIFGPIIGAIPGVLMLLAEDPSKALQFAIIILIIQQIDGNILGPKLIGGRLKINAFWILFSVVVFGKLFGVVGMFFGVPLFTTLYKVLKEYIHQEETTKEDNNSESSEPSNNIQKDNKVNK